MLKIIPYKKYWYSCSINNMMSILTSVNPTYEIFMLENDYYYTIEIDPYDNDRVNICFEQEKYEKLIKYKYEEFKIADVENIIYNAVNMQKILMFPVNLGFWLEDSIAYGRVYYNHYVLVVGYDIAKNEVYILDDDKNGYNIHKVGYRHFIKCVEYSGNNTLKKIEYTYESENKNIDFESIKKNAGKLQKSIDYVVMYIDSLSRQDSFFEMRDFYMTPFVLENRFRANSDLTKLLLKENLINMKQYEETIKIISDNLKETRRLKMYTTKLMIAKKNGDCSNINRKVVEILERERNFWNKLLEK